MAEHVDVLTRPVVWQRMNTRVFGSAAHVDGEWWVLRFNSFPDHPPFTLFIGGTVVGDLYDIGTTAPAWDLDTAGRALTEERRAEVLALMRGLGPYGSEAGQPCAGDWCQCDRRTDEYAAE
jgi:hypothetical protein